MKNDLFIVIILLAGLNPRPAAGQVQKEGTVFSRFLLPARVTDTTRLDTIGPRSQQDSLPVEGALLPEKIGARGIQVEAVAPRKPVAKKEKAR